jgi:hypothetical protein
MPLFRSYAKCSPEVGNIYVLLIASIVRRTASNGRAVSEYRIDNDIGRKMECSGCRYCPGGVVMV